MKKLFMILPLILMLCFATSCQQQANEVERIMEDGVEVIINGIEPFEIQGEPKTLILESEFSIDLEADDIVEIGFTESPKGVDVDSEGFIYLFQGPGGNRNTIFKFNEQGEFVTSFGRTGEGPGEFKYYQHVRIIGKDKIAITDLTRRKLIIYKCDGSFEKSIPLPPEVVEAYPLANGNYLVLQNITSIEGKYLEWPVWLYDSELTKLKELDKYISLNEFTSDTFEYPIPGLNRSVSNDKIYIGSARRGYEIHVYDLDGILVRKIRKDYEKVELSDEKKEEILKMTERGVENPSSTLYQKKIEIAKHWPPFQYLFADDGGRLYVMTYESGVNSSEYLYDVYNPEGIFVARFSLNNHVINSHWDIQYMVVRNNRIYCLQQRESGYMSLVVYKMRWE